MWSVMGSFACIAVAFICPVSAYLKVGSRLQPVKRVWAWVILVAGIVVMVACVTQTIYNLSRPAGGPEGGGS